MNLDLNNSGGVGGLWNHLCPDGCSKLPGIVRCRRAMQPARINIYLILFFQILFFFLPTPAFKSIGQYFRTSSDPSAIHVWGLLSQKKPSKPNTTEMNFVILLTNFLCNKIKNEHNISYIYIWSNSMTSRCYITCRIIRIT